MNPAAELRLQAVRLRLLGRELIGPLDATVAPGECLTLMGPSGCGKSSLLNFLAGTLDGVFEASGRALIGDIDLTGMAPERRRIGILFQDDLLFPHLSVGGNLAFALPADVRLTSLYSRRDAVVNWRACIDTDPQSTSIEVSSTHTGFPWNVQVYHQLGMLLASTGP